MESNKPTDRDQDNDFYVAYQKVGSDDFSNSSIAYGFQISTIYPFLFWGATSFLFVPLTNAIFWGIGIFLFHLSFRKIANLIQPNLTLHSLLGLNYGRKTGVIASILSMVGFVGYIVAELWIGSRVIFAVVPESNLALFIAASASLSAVFLYLNRYGQRASIATDQIQIVLSYIGVLGVFGFLIFESFKADIVLAGELFWSLLTLSAMAAWVLWKRKLKFITPGSTLRTCCNAILSAGFIALILSTSVLLASKDVGVASEGIYSLEGVGIVGLISLIILPLVWQFVDLTNWQRILSVKEKRAGEIDATRKGLLQFGVESPFTWVMFLTFGLLTATVFPSVVEGEILVDLPAMMIGSGNVIEILLSWSFIVAILAVMTSTVDSLLMGISFTYAADIDPIIKRSLLGHSNLLDRSKAFTVLVVLLSLVMLALLNQFTTSGGNIFISFLLTFYSATVAFAPLVFGMIFPKYQANGNWALAAMLLGSISGLIVGIFSIFGDGRLAWYPICLSFGISSLIYAIGIVNSKKKG